MRVGVKPSGQNFTCCRAAKAPGKKVCGKSKKVVDKDTLFGYNIPCQQRRAAPDKPNNGDLHSGSAVDSDSTCGSSILSSPTRPQPNRLRYFRGIAQLVARLVRDEEAVGSNPAAPTKKDQYTLCTGLFSSSQRDLQRRRPPPAAGTGSRGWGSGQQDANAAQGMKRMLGNRNPVQGGPAAGRGSNQPAGPTR